IRCETLTDTEVVLRLLDRDGLAALHRLNGQFAFAIYDRRRQSVFLARDRFGILPLFYAERDGDLYFASEIKALFATGEVDRAADPVGLDQVFTFWAARPPRTPFRAVRALEPGCCALWREGRLAERRYYAVDYSDVRPEGLDARRELDGTLRASVWSRLVADVPVGAYLSGGVDSSAVCALASAATLHALRTFSVTFDDPRFDESAYQRTVAEALDTRHAVQRIGGADIARVFPDVVRHAETPLLRTAPAPLFLLSRLTRERGITVVLSGEGADEVFLGYDVFKETAVRLFCARQPGSAVRPRLFDRLYPYFESAGRGNDFWRGFFLSAGAPADPLFSHLPRFQLTSRIKDFYSSDFRAALAGVDALDQLRDALPRAFGRWSPLHRAAYLEFTTLLSPYLLSTQGDRMSMAHGVEARVPFLDHRVVEFAAALPETSKLRGLREKRILKRWAADVLPAAVAQRVKQPYRAPDVPPFFAPGAPAYVRELLAPEALAETGIFDPAPVAGLVRRCAAGRGMRTWESQALVGILSTQLWQREFLAALPQQTITARRASPAAAAVA
ncbi:MAG TPA: asparagine synthase (glutamine-hydrolyzing), partial [Gemmatimonadales bacterium]